MGAGPSPTRLTRRSRPRPGFRAAGPGKTGPAATNDRDPAWKRDASTNRA
jgi:hypothetical protein